MTKGRATGKISIISPVGNCLGGLRIGRNSCIAMNRPLTAVSRGDHLILHTRISRGCCGCLPSVRSTGFHAPCSGIACGLSSLHKHLLSCNGTSSAGSFCIPIAFRFSGGKTVVPNSFIRVCLLATPVRGIVDIPISTLVRRRNICSIFIHIRRRTCGGIPIALNTSGNSRIRVLDNLGTNSRIIAINTCRVGLTSTSGTVPTRARGRW